jgi:hypothetical protein
MRVQDGQVIARKWVREHAESHPNFRGAFFTGSITALEPSSELPPTSDVDLFVVLAGRESPLKLGKILVNSVLLEVSYISINELADPDQVATNYHLAHAFARDNIIADPTGRLRSLHDAISPAFARPEKIRRRCDNAIEKILNGLNSIDANAPWHDAVLSWLFPTSIATHVILVAAMRNPTIRLRFPAAREVLRRHELDDTYEQILDLIGCRQITPSAVQHQLNALAAMFDTAARVARTPFFFSSDITTIARPIAIAGSQHLIDAGDHREAVFWILATFARCMKILSADAPPDDVTQPERAFRDAVADLTGVRTFDDIRVRRERTLEFIPHLRAIAEELVDDQKHMLRSK